MSIDAIKVLGSLLGSGNASRGSGNSALGSILGSVLSGQGSQNSSAVTDVLGSLLGGASGGQSAGGLGGALGGLLGGAQQQSGGGADLGSMLGGLLGGGAPAAGGAGGGLADILGGVLGGGAGGQSGGGLGDLLGAALGQHAQQKNPNMPNPDRGAYLPQGVDIDAANRQAELVIKAMINAAKADGTIDDQEKEAIIGKLGDDVTQDEINFVRQEFNAPLDANALAREVPNGMGDQIYAISLTAIDLDQNKEAQYLHQLAQALNISSQRANQIHDQLGVQKIYG